MYRVKAVASATAWPSKFQVLRAGGWTVTWSSVDEPTVSSMASFQMKCPSARTSRSKAVFACSQWREPHPAWRSIDARKRRVLVSRGARQAGAGTVRAEAGEADMSRDFVRMMEEASPVTTGRLRLGQLFLHRSLGRLASWDVSRALLAVGILLGPDRVVKRTSATLYDKLSR